MDAPGTQKPKQIVFIVQGMPWTAPPIRKEEFSAHSLDVIQRALCQDCEAFQGRGAYADYMLHGLHIRYDDMTEECLTGVIVPDHVEHSPDDPGASFKWVLFNFAIVLKKNDIDSQLRHIIGQFIEQGFPYSLLPDPPYCVLVPQEGNASYKGDMMLLYAMMRGYAMGWALLNKAL